jgi:outer membrane immunogenic protein
MKSISRLLGAAAAIAIFAGTGQAADYAVPDSPSWTGAYIGVVGGYGWGDSDFESDVVDATDNTVILQSVDGSISPKGFLVGGQLGYDFDLGNSLVLGVVGDISWSGMDGDTCVETGGCDGSPDDSYTSANLNWLGTIRARAGFTTGSMLIYGTGGLAIGEAEGGLTFIEGGADPSRSDNNTHMGWVIGAGAEFKVAENMSLGVEYLHVDLGSEDYTFRGPTVDVLSSSDLTVDIVRASLNFRF